MAKRLISVLLAAVMMISILPFASAEGETVETQETTATETTVPETTVPATTTPEELPPIEDPGYNGYKASDACIAVLKKEEGFSERPYWDYSQWTVGYGTKCPDDMKAYYDEHGITDRDAEVLLRNHLQGVYRDVVNYMVKNSLNLSQNQFDALVLFSYNCGTGWSFDSTGTLYNAIAKGATGNNLIRAFALWCIAGGQVQDFLLRRRLSEANMYLNNVYSQTPPDNYCYVYYDANGGSVSPRSQGYDSNLTAAPFSTPTYAGYTFKGWFTQPSGGTQVTVLDRSVKGATLYAQWVNEAGQAPESNEQTVNVTITVTHNDVNLRKGPGTNYTIVGTANAGRQFTITAVATGSGYTWGKYDGGWVCLKYTNYDSVKDTPSQPQPETPPQETTPQEPAAPAVVTGTVKANGGLCVRTGPGTGYSAIRYAANGSKVQILEQKTVGSMTWGKISDGWVSMKYVVLDSAGEQTPSTPTTPSEPSTPSAPPATNTVTGTITAVGGLRVRSGPGIGHSVVRYIYKGTKVQITETKTEGSTTWGKIADGWISMDYVKLDSNGSADQTPNTPTNQTGTVKVGDCLRVRSGPGTSYAVCGYLYNGNTVTITETKTVGATLWGKIANGWISMDYVVVAGGSSNSGSANAVIKTVTASCLCVRSDAGTSNKIVSYLYNGSKVEILETKSAGGTTWGRISSGWICMDYVK
ncbi:MAG: SH3 domain-containing protein [Oscillospiraceae bacterium]|nr:SH3 domain-containing protein [Oscillospiraceae bacterium]